MTQGSFSCKQSVIYGRRVNSCKQKPTWSSRAATGPFLGRSLACLPAFFFPFMPKVFRTAISSVLIWVCSPAGLAKPFIILRAWSCEAPSQVVFFFFLNSRWPRLLYLFPPNERGRYSSSEALPSAHPSVGRFAFFFSPSTGVKARGKCHFTWLICHTVTT